MTEQSYEQPVQHRLKLRNTRLSDYEDIREIMNLVYPTMGGAWTREQFASQIARFPEGQICIEDNGKVVASAISLIVDYARYGDKHTYTQITGNGYLTTHDPRGDTLYGVDIFVHPAYRDMRLVGASTMPVKSCAKTSICAPSSSADASQVTGSITIS